MKNPIIGTAHFGNVYRRKIHVYAIGTPKTAPHITQFYAWSTNAHRTCREAVAAAKLKEPRFDFKASFAKD
jgi:hypothetical protein